MSGNQLASYFARDSSDAGADVVNSDRFFFDLIAECKQFSECDCHHHQVFTVVLV